MMIWGFNVSALAVLVNSVDPIILTSARIFVAGIFVLIIARIMCIFRLPNKSELIVIFVISIFNVVLHHLFLAVGLTKTAGVNTGIILGAGPIVTMILSIVFLKDNVTKIRAGGFLLGFTGIILTSLIGATRAVTLSIGDGIIFLAMLVQAISFILI